MGTISDKLTYLNTTKTKIREGLNSLGADLDTEDTFRSYADAIDEIYENYPKITGEGTDLSLDNTKQASMEIDYKGNTSQVSYSGKSIIDLATYSSKDSNVTLSFIDNNLLVSMSSGSYGKVIYDVTNLFKANQGKKINIRYYSIDLTSYTGTSSNTLIQIKRNSTNTTLLNAELTKTIYTIPSDITDSDVFQIAIFGSGSSSNASSVTYNKLMFYFGEESASFEPYVGGTASPNPSYPQPINVVSGDNTIDIRGKNLFNKDDYSYVNAGFNAGTLNTLTSNANAYTIYIPCKPNQTYTLTKTKGARFFVGYTKTTPALNVEVFGRAGANDSTQWTITTDSDAQYLVALVYNSSVDTSLTLQQVLDTVMIENNSSATTYEPYIGNSYHITLPSGMELCNIGTYEDYIRKSTGINLFDKSKVTTGVLNADGTISSGNLYITDFIEVKPNTNYITNELVGSHRGKYYNASKQAITNDFDFNLNSNTKILTTNEAKYVRFAFTSTLADTLQFQEGSTSLPYEPYGKVWYLHKEIGKVILDGTEAGWTTQTQTGFYRYGLTINDMNNVSSLASEILIKSTGFRGISFNDRGSDTSETIYVVSNGQQHGFFVNTQFTSITNFKNYLGTNNIPLIYVLAIPTNTPITDTTLINQLEESKLSYISQTNISQVNNDLPFELDVKALRGE